MLQPHGNLEKLKIDFYGCNEFPTWIGHPLFVKLESVSLGNCVKCTSLPPLGQLCQLKHLRIGGKHGVKRIVVEFFMGDHPLEHPFPSLETLKLTMFKCPKLTKVSAFRLPLLLELDLEQCTKVTLDRVMDLNSLTYLKLESITGLSYLPSELMQRTAKLEVLENFNCNAVPKLWESGICLQTLISLGHFVIAHCPNLVCLGDEDQQLPNNLEVLELFHCETLSSLPADLSSLMSLRELIIKNCPRLTTFPEIGVPPMLRRLEIQGCNALKSLPNGIASLERLKLKDCSSLRAWPPGSFPTAFKKCHKEMQASRPSSIWNWEQIRSLLQYMHSFSRLVQLYISNCGSLESFPNQGLPTPSLRILSVEHCSNLKSIPAEINRISSLISLEVRSCPKLESFPKGELPGTLTSLRVWDSKKLRPLEEWHLDRLASLQEFSICSGFKKLASFGDAKRLFPSSLTKFSIARFPSLKSLVKGLDSLTSLQHLSI